MENKAEDNYPENQENPKPSAEALNEKDDEKAGINVQRVIIIAVVILAIVYFLFFRDTRSF